MKTLLSCSTLLLLMISSVNGFSQESTFKEQRPVSSFSAIEASGIAHVYLIKGNQEKVEIEVNRQILSERLKIEVSNNTLVIRLQDKKRNGDEYRDAKINVYVTYKQINKVDGSGATSIDTKNAINSDKLSINISGANNTKLDLNVKELKIETSGASNATLKGITNKLYVEASGASNVKAYDLKAGDVKAETSGVSNANVAAEKTIDIHASGLSNINYRGDAQVIAKEVSKMANANKH